VNQYLLIKDSKKDLIRATCAWFCIDIPEPEKKKMSSKKKPPHKKPPHKKPPHKKGRNAKVKLSKEKKLAKLAKAAKVADLLLFPSATNDGSSDGDLKQAAK
jgi:hypothetical protein